MRKAKGRGNPAGCPHTLSKSPFKVKEDEEMAQLMRSIADAGVLSPALARAAA